MRLFLLAVSLAALGALWWFLDDLLTMRAWVIMHRGAEPEITRGWPIVYAIWPVALAGVLLGGGIVTAILSVLMARAQDHDHQWQVEHLRQRLDEAMQQATHAEQTARSALQADRNQVEQLRAKALEAIRQAEGLRQQALSDQATAREWVAQANTEREHANRRANNASAAFARKARKVAVNPTHQNENGSVDKPSCPQAKHTA